MNHLAHKVKLDVESDIIKDSCCILEQDLFLLSLLSTG